MQPEPRSVLTHGGSAQPKVVKWVATVYRGKHTYVSTACWHQMHHTCRQTCKHCDEPCRCECHQGDPDVGEN